MSSNANNANTATTPSSAHLSDIDILRMLAFDAKDDAEATRAFEDHASQCERCAKRVEREAALDLLLLDARPGSRNDAADVDEEQPPRRTSNKRAIATTFAVVALAAGIALSLGIRGSKHGTNDEPSIVPARADLYPSALASAGSSTINADAWVLAGSQHSRYEKSSESADSASPVIRVLRRTDGRNAYGFGTLMQSFSAASYAGKRVRFSADVEVRDVDLWAGLWMRADTPARSAAAFDNMQGRPIRGTMPWARYVVVLDIPNDAHAIALGILVAGSGTARLADARVEIVGSDVPITAPSPAPRPLASDFSP